MIYPNAEFISFYKTTDYYRENVDAVPLPAAVWLLGSGLVGLIGLRRKTAL